MKCTERVNKRFLTTHSRNYLAVGLFVGGGIGVLLSPTFIDILYANVNSVALRYRLMGKKKGFSE